jgi:hypothetical protein
MIDRWRAYVMTDQDYGNLEKLSVRWRSFRVVIKSQTLRGRQVGISYSWEP